MAINYPLGLPTVAGISNIALRAENVTSFSRSPFSFAQKVYSYSGQMWSADVTLPPMDRGDAEEWVGFLLSLKGQAGTFLMGDPAGDTARGSLGGTPLVNGSDQTGGTLVVDGATPSVTNWLRVGDYIQIGTGSSSRLHKVLQSADSDASGNVSLDIWPDLRASPADDEAITVSNARGVWRLATSVQDWNTSAAQIYGITFAAIEAL